MSSKATFFLLALILGCVQAHAKRTAPEDVTPALSQGVRYSAPHWGKTNGKKQNGGYIQANDRDSRKLLWKLRVYEVKYDPNLEADVQDVFITSLKIVEGILEVLNEAGDKFIIDLSTRKVIRGVNRVYRNGKLRAMGPQARRRNSATSLNSLTG